MKIVFALLTLLTSYSFAQTVLYTQDFEQGIPMATWSIVTVDTNTVNDAVSEFAPGWISLPDPADSSDTIIGATSYFQTPGTAERWIFTPSIALAPFGNYLTWKAKSHDPSYPDNYKVFVATAPNVDSVIDTLANVIGEMPSWNDYEIKLSDKGLDNQTIFIAFVLTTTDGFKLYLDDIEVRGNDPLAVNELKEENIRMYPNPANEFLSFSTAVAIEKIELFDLSGQLVKSVFNQQQVLTSDLKEGIYMVRTYTSAGLGNQKLVIKH